MSAPNPEAARELAERDVAAINRLLECPAFDGYFRRRLREERAASAKALENFLEEAETVRLRHRIAVIDWILQLPEQDRQLHAATLRLA